MAYEIDFVGSDKVTKDYGAIAFRYWSPSANRWVVCVFDGGTSEAGVVLSKHIETYYLQRLPKEIDMVFCSHPDLDHASGLKNILQKYSVRYLIMNRPWLYLDELYEKVKDGRITKESLERTLREKYKFIDELESLAVQQRDCKIIPGLTESVLFPTMSIVSPTREFYIQSLVDSEKTPAMDSATGTISAQSFVSNALRALVKWIKTIWGKDDIREGETTSAENESSIVLEVQPDGDEPFLLLGDVGCKGLSAAMDFADTNSIPLNRCTFLQIPHHGGRHNVSPSVLDRLVGCKVTNGTKPIKVAFVSVGKGSDHPRKCVTNAFINRGCNVYVSSATTLHHYSGKVPDRGWTTAKAEPFSSEVESWDS